MLQTAAKPINPDQLDFQRAESSLFRCIEANHEGLNIRLYLNITSGNPSVSMHVARDTENSDIDYLFNEYMKQSAYSLSSTNINDWEALDSLFGGRYAWQNLLWRISQRVEQILTVA